MHKRTFVSFAVIGLILISHTAHAEVVRLRYQGTILEASVGAQAVVGMEAGSSFTWGFFYEEGVSSVFSGPDAFDANGATTVFATTDGSFSGVIGGGAFIQHEVPENTSHIDEVFAGDISQSQGFLPPSVPIDPAFGLPDFEFTEIQHGFHPGSVPKVETNGLTVCRT